MSSARRIDTPAHIVPPFYKEWLASKSVDAGGLPIPTWSVESTLDFMQANGIETSIMAVSTPGVEPFSRGAPSELATSARGPSRHFVAAQ
jgi:hypothetical protein